MKNNTYLCEYQFNLIELYAMRWILAIVLVGFLFAGCSDIEEAYLEPQTEIPCGESESAISSDDVSDAEIGNIINRIFQAKSRSNSEYTTEIIYTDKGTPGMYVINFADNGGFLLISATKKHEPILAHSESGHYNLTDMEKPLPVLEWQNSMLSDIQRAREESDTLNSTWNAFREISETIDCRSVLSRSDPYGLETMIADSLTSWRRKGYSVSSIDSYEPRDDVEKAFLEDLCNNMYPIAVDNWKDYVFVVRYTKFISMRIDNMLETQWHQGSNFNAYFPFWNGTKEKQAVGCGPIAVGQIMRYHKKPANINWNDMPATYATNSTAEFLYNLALKADAKYETKENLTSTTIPNLKKAFESYGYKCKLGNYNHYTVMQNIKANRPVLMSGIDVDSGKGHAWLISGVQDYENANIVIIYYPISRNTMNSAFEHQDNPSHTYTHYCNWGWGGLYDGFFGMDRFDPGNRNYSSNNRMLYDIYY